MAFRDLVSLGTLKTAFVHVFHGFDTCYVSSGSEPCFFVWKIPKCIFMLNSQYVSMVHSKITVYLQHSKEQNMALLLLSGIHHLIGKTTH